MKKLVKLTLVVTVVLAGLSGIALNKSVAQESEEIKLSASFKLQEGKRAGFLYLTADVIEGSYIYALTQKKTPPPSKIKFTESKKYSIGKFVSNKKPKIVYDDIFEANMEKHFGITVFKAPFELADGTDIDKLELTLKFTGQVCNDSMCIRIKDKKVVAKFGGYLKKESEKKTGSVDKQSHEK